MIRIIHGDCLDVLRTLPAESVHAVVTDPPYGLAFMGKRWDYDVPSVEVWAECLRVLKPGGHLLAFAGTRTQHRMAVRIEDAGFEIRDMIAWVYGSGFPKSLDVSKAIDAGDRIGMSRERSLKFTAFMRSTGLTASEINAATDTFMGSHYLTDKEQPAVATEELFAMLRPLIAARGVEIPDEIEELVRWRTVESENLKRREVVGTRVASDFLNARPLSLAAQGVQEAGRREISITAAHTAAAQKWEGWGTALKPALEPITVARKPLAGTVAENVLAHGTGAINVDGCRVEGGARPLIVGENGERKFSGGFKQGSRCEGTTTQGRWPANLIHDGSDEVVELFPVVESGEPSGVKAGGQGNAYGLFAGGIPVTGYGDRGSAARFFYCAKADAGEREMGMELQQKFGGGRSNTHPTVKPVDLMRYLIRLVTPKGGTVLDPFAGSGTTGLAALAEQVDAILIERESQYVDIAAARVRGTAGLFADAELIVENN